MQQPYQPCLTTVRLALAASMFWYSSISTPKAAVHDINLAPTAGAYTYIKSNRAIYHSSTLTTIVRLPFCCDDFHFRFKLDSLKLGFLSAAVSCSDRKLCEGTREVTSEQQFITVSSSSELSAALASASAGTVILLAPGQYGFLNLWDERDTYVNYAGEVTIRSANSDDPAVFSSMKLTGVDNLTIDSVKFDYVSPSGAPAYAKPFQIDSSTHITIKNSTFDGDLAHGVDDIQDGFGTGYGLDVKDSTDITIESNDFFNWDRAVAFGRVTNLVVSGNDVHDIRSDGFDFVNVDNVLIEGNSLHDFRKAAGSGDHADMIQFWTANSTKSVHEYYHYRKFSQQRERRLDTIDIHEKRVGRHRPSRRRDVLSEYRH